MQRPRSDRFTTRSLAGSIRTEREQEAWFNSCKDYFIPKGKVGMTLLKKESCKNGVIMLQAFEKSSEMFHRMRRVRELTKAESVAIIMYTLHDPKFYVHFNKNCSSGQWKKYQVYSALLFSACLKLAEKDPVDQLVYRGTGKIGMLSNSKSLYWPQFISASLNKSVAQAFAKETIVFNTCQYGAKIKDLSAFPEEDEVLILPFEKFVKTRIRRRDGNDMLCFESSDDQPLIGQCFETEESDDNNDDDDENIDSDESDNSNGDESGNGENDDDESNDDSSDDEDESDRGDNSDNNDDKSEDDDKDAYDEFYYYYGQYQQTKKFKFWKLKGSSAKRCRFREGGHEHSYAGHDLKNETNFEILNIKLYRARSLVLNWNNNYSVLFVE